MEGVMPASFQSPREKIAESSAIRSQLGRELRAAYEPDLKTPIPQRLRALLCRLAQRDKLSGKKA
jgi:hypothetical protein